jgi:DNA-binding beta-propeller fold protein YncE
VTQPRIAAFARLANGNAGPRRVISGQRTRLGRTAHGIAYNPVRDEIVVPNPFAAAILTFRGDASGDVAPLRIIQGPKTGLISPHSLGLDVANKELIVADVGARQVMVFPWDAQGDVAPIRVIGGSNAQFAFVVGPAVDPGRDLLIVSTYTESTKGTGDGKILVFRRTDNGNVAPQRIIGGPRTGIRSPWQVQVDPEAGKIFVAIENAYRQYGRFYVEGKPQEGRKDIPPSPWRSDMPGFIGVWDIDDQGDVPPRDMIRGALSQIVHPSGLYISPAAGEVMATDSVRNGVFTFHVPQFFNRSRPTESRAR